MFEADCFLHGGFNGKRCPDCYPSDKANGRGKAAPKRHKAVEGSGPSAADGACDHGSEGWSRRWDGGMYCLGCGLTPAQAWSRMPDAEKLAGYEKLIESATRATADSEATGISGSNATDKNNTPPVRNEGPYKVGDRFPLIQSEPHSAYMQITNETERFFANAAHTSAIAQVNALAAKFFADESVYEVFMDGGKLVIGIGANTRPFHELGVGRDVVTMLQAAANHEQDS
jgi:hypothetical protein